MLDDVVGGERRGWNSSSASGTGGTVGGTSQGGKDAGGPGGSGIIVVRYQVTPLSHPQQPPRTVAKGNAHATNPVCGSFHLRLTPGHHYDLAELE